MIDFSPVLLWVKEKDRALITPKRFVAYLKKQACLERIDVGRVGIFCFRPSVLHYLIRRTGAREINDWLLAHRESTKLYNFELNGTAISLMGLDFGAPFCATIMEILIACGMRTIFTIGSAGTLQDDIPIGDFVIARDAIRAEGLSHHYLKPSKKVMANRGAVSDIKTACDKYGCRYHIGTTWTTDAIFRETVSQVQMYKREGVLTVDMEAAALYTIAKVRKVDCACFFCITDSLANLRWTPKFHTTKQGLEKGCDIILEAVNIALKRSMHGEVKHTR